MTHRAAAARRTQPARGLTANLELSSLTRGRVLQYAIPEQLKSEYGVTSMARRNYVPHARDEPIPALDAGRVESRWTEAHLGHPVVKALNSITAGSLATLGRPAGAPGRVALPVAGDDPAAKQLVIFLADQLGFDAVDAGGLDASWRQQPGTPVYTADLDADGVCEALAGAAPERTTAWRARWADHTSRR